MLPFERARIRARSHLGTGGELGPVPRLLGLVAGFGVLQLPAAVWTHALNLCSGVC